MLQISGTAIATGLPTGILFIHVCLIACLLELILADPDSADYRPCPTPSYLCEPMYARAIADGPLIRGEARLSGGTECQAKATS